MNLDQTSASESTAPQPPIPAGVTILGLLMIAAGAFDLVQGAGLVGVTDPIEANLGPFNIPLGLLFIATGIGFLKRFSWAWIPGVLLGFLNLVRTFAVALQDGIVAVPGIFVAVLIIYYLFTPRVRTYFGTRASG